VIEFHRFVALHPGFYYNGPVKYSIKTGDDLTWLLAHTHAFQGGQVTDLHIRKQRLFDETTGRDIAAGTTIAAVIRYDLAIQGDTGLYPLTRVARLTMVGATDFSIFEQEGADCSEIGTIHAEASAGRLRFWFDPHGELYVICDEAVLEEISLPGTGQPSRTGMTEWTFQAPTGALPSVSWLLAHLDRAGVPCTWQAAKRSPSSHRALRWEGRLVPATAPHRPVGGRGRPRIGGVLVQAYGPLDSYEFMIALRAASPQDRATGRLFIALADLIARSFPGLCLVGDQIMDGEEWLGHGLSGHRPTERPQDQAKETGAKTRPST